MLQNIGSEKRLFYSVVPKLGSMQGKKIKTIMQYKMSED
jgi:hypothetical protein